MTSSGTEAAMSAVRLARAVTGREVVVKFAGAYHGHSDGLLADAGSGLATLASRQPRRHRGAGGRHRRRALERPRGGRRGRWPSTRSPRCWPSRSPPTWASSRPPRASSSSSATATREAGALLVFDEVITGFRVARGGAQELYGVEPDLTVLGKVLGGGLPAAAFAGPRELMERIAPAGDVYQAGTLSGNPLAIAAGLATLRAARRRRLRAPRRADRPPRRRLRRAGRRAGRCRSPRPPACSPSSSAQTPVTDFAAAARLRHRGPRPLLPGDARARRLPAAVAVRGLVRLPRPRRGDDRPHPRSRRRVARGGPRDERRPRTSRRCALARRAAARGGHADLAARGRARRARRSSACSPRSARAAAAPGEYALVVEAVREGYLLHYGEPRLLAGHDADLALLAGDYLYALGLDRLAALGDAARSPSSPT